MKPPVTPSRSIGDLRALTPARVGLGLVGASVPTQALLGFTLDHARARDAVHAVFDVSGISAGLQELGLPPVRVMSRAPDRKDYLRRPDLGRLLDPASQLSLAEHDGEPCELAIVIGDGLSPSAVNAHAVALVKTLMPHLARDGIEIDRAVVTTGARVALGDEIGVAIGARMVAMLIGERPGLSASDSLGVYLTFAPKPGLTDAERNCVSNIHAAGLGYEEAAVKIAWLIREGLRRQHTGVALKDESGEPMLKRIASNAGEHDP